MVALRVSDLRFSIQGRTILDGVSLEVQAGEMVGVIGPNGSGKSTLLRLIYRYLEAEGGRVELGGDEVGGLSHGELARRLSAVLQIEEGVMTSSVRESVGLGRSPWQGWSLVESEEDQKRVEAGLELMGLVELEHRPVHELSGGERQKTLLARALVGEASLLLLDEPTNHLDLRHRMEILQKIRATDLGALVVLHDLELASKFCDRLLLLNQGRTLAFGKPDQVLTGDLIAEAFGIQVEIIEHPQNGRPVVLYQ